jgi:hypothetical protein
MEKLWKKSIEEFLIIDKRRKNVFGTFLVETMSTTFNLKNEIKFTYLGRKKEIGNYID